MQGGRRIVTILFADLEGSTDIGDRLDPEALSRVTDRYFETLSAVVTRHGGTVEKYIGDAVVAVFGVPVLHEDDALRAVRSAAEIVAEVRSLNDEIGAGFWIRLDVRVGLNTGEVVTNPLTEPGQRLITGDADTGAGAAPTGFSSTNGRSADDLNLTVGIAMTCFRAVVAGGLCPARRPRSAVSPQW